MWFFVASFILLDLVKALSFDIRVLSLGAVVWWVFRVAIWGGFWCCLLFRLVGVRYWAVGFVSFAVSQGCFLFSWL